MSIQQSLNQALGIGAVLATQTPAYKAQVEKKTEEAALKREEKGLEAQSKILGETLKGMSKGEDYSEAVINETAQRAVEAQRRISEIKPTAENIQRYLKTATTVENVNKASDSFKQAKENMRAKREAGKNLRQRAKEALEKAKEEQSARVEGKSRILTNINKWGELNGK